MSDRWLNLKQVAERIGYSPSWIYHNRAKLQVEHGWEIHRAGKGKLKFLERDVNAFIKANIVQ